MNCGYIYKIVFPNGKHYIGLTTNSLKQRTREHKSCAKNDDTRCLYKALRKYNMIDTFELIEIDTSDILEELCKKEIKYIDDYNSHYINGNGYNMTNGGEGTIGYIYTDESRQKASEAQKKRFEDPDEIQKISEAAKKRWENPEEREKISESQQKRWEKPEEREKASEAQKTRFKNPEEIKKISEAAKKRCEDPEEIQKMSERGIQFHKDHPEAGEEQSEKMKKYYEENPEEREKMSERGKQYYDDHPEAKEKMSETLKNYYKENPDAIQKNSEARKKFHKDHPEAAKKQSEALKKTFEENPQLKKTILDTKGQNKPFDIFKDDGTYIKTFTYQCDAREYLQKEHSITSKIKISEVLGGKRKSSAGFVFKYK